MSVNGASDGVSLPYWVDSQTIAIPVTVESEADDMIGDGSAQITADDPAFRQWAEWLEATGHPQPRL